jgi:hypothetical protein
MKNELLVASFVLSASPGLAMLLFGTSNLVQFFGIAIIAFSVLMMPFGLFTRGGGITKFAWIILGLVLFTLMLAMGYIPLAGGFSIGLNSSLVELVSLCVVLVEMAIVFSTMFGNYKAYESELKKAGYDKEEFYLELGSFDRFLILLTLGSAGIASVIYSLFSLTPSIGIDTLTGLVIVAIIYFIIARYVLSQRKVTTTKAVNDV